MSNKNSACPECGHLPLHLPLFHSGMAAALKQADLGRRELFFHLISKAYSNLDAIEAVIDLIENFGELRRMPDPAALAALLRGALSQATGEMERAAELLEQEATS